MAILEDNERFLRRFRERIDRVGIELPRIEVRFEHLNVEADVYVGSRALPTLLNFVLNFLENVLSLSRKERLPILHDVSGILKPGRMTFLLGPPGSGKTSLLLAMAGKLDKRLKLSGKLTYNGHEMSEFVPERTCAFVGQGDIHLGQLTVRETLEFSARCQGAGSRSEIVAELVRREKQLGIEPDLELDDEFIKALCCKNGHLMTDYVMKILGLDVCADTLLGDEMRRGISGGQKKRVNTGEPPLSPLRYEIFFLRFVGFLEFLGNSKGI